MNTVDSRMIQVPGKLQKITQDIINYTIQFKNYDLLLSEIFFLVFLDHSQPWP